MKKKYEVLRMDYSSIDDFEAKVSMVSEMVSFHSENAAEEWIEEDIRSRIAGTQFITEVDRIKQDKYIIQPYYTAE